MPVCVCGVCVYGGGAHRDRQHLHQGPACGVWRKRGRSIQAIGRSRGGWTTKVHALTDVIGRPYALMRTAGTVGDGKAAPALLQRAGRRNRKRTVRYDKDRYWARHLIENAFCRLKDFRRVATRHDKLADNFLSGGTRNRHRLALNVSGS